MGTRFGAIPSGQDGVVLADLADVTGPTALGRVSGTGAPQALTPAQMRAASNAIGKGTAVLAELPDTGAADAAAGLNTLLAAGGTIIVPPGTYRLDAQLVIPADTTLYCMPGVVMRRTWTGTVGDKVGNATIRNENAVWGELLVDPGPYSVLTTDANIRIIGGHWEAAEAADIGCGLVLTAVEDAFVANVTFGRCYGDWAFTFGGDRLTATGLRLLDGQNVFEDGIHVAFGTDISIHAHEINSGDDMVAVGTGRNMAADNVRVVVERGRSTKGHAAVVFQDRDGLSAAFGAPTETVTNVAVHLGHVRAGLTRNGLVDVRSDVAGLVSQVAITADSIDGGNETHDGTNNYGIRVNTATDVDIAIGRLRRPRRSVLEATDATVSLTVDADDPSVSGFLPAVDADNSTVALAGTFRRGSFHVVRADNGSKIRVNGLDLLDVANTFSAVLLTDGTLVGTDLRCVRASGATSSQGIRVNATTSGFAVAAFDATDIDRTFNFTATPAFADLIAPIGAAKQVRIVTGAFTSSDPESLVLVRTGNTTDTLSTIGGGFAGRRIRVRNGEADPATNAITLNNSGGTNQVVSASTWLLNTAGKFVDLEHDGTKWYVRNSGGFGV